MKRNRFFKIIFFIALLLPTISIFNVLGFDLDPGGSGGSDTTPPTLTILTPSSNQIYGTSVTVTWSAYDASGIGKYYVKVDTGNWILKNLGTTHTFTGLTPGKRTFSVKAYDTKNNYVTKSKTDFIVSDENYIHLQSIHKTEFYINTNKYCYATISMDYKVWFDFDTTTRRVTYTYFHYITQISLYNSPSYPMLSRVGFDLWDYYCTWVFDSYYGDVHTIENPAQVQVLAPIQYGRELEGDLTEGDYNIYKIYVGLNYYCGIMVNGGAWEIQCKMKCDGVPYLNCYFSTYTPGPSGGSGIEWNDHLIYYDWDVYVV
jgi:hypothetical protein